MSQSTQSNPRVAYFCAEYGLDSGMPIYAGGLGVLAGDTIKEAADMNFPLVALGLLYRGCGARQFVDETGMQHEEDVMFNPEDFGYEHVFVPGSDAPLVIEVHLSVMDVWAKVWKKRIGNSVDLYLLDTDTEQNDDDQRGVACALYNGGDDFLLKQQMVLGIGGVKVLHALGIHPDIYHVNEGRPAFLYWQLIKHYMHDAGLSFVNASEKAKSQIVYTNHTLVKAGNNAYATDLLKKYGAYYAETFGVGLQELLAPGIDDEAGSFSMTDFALNTSKRASAVSTIHYDLSKNLWPHYEWHDITNGVHLPTWQDPVFVDTESLSDAQLWDAHMDCKTKLREYVTDKTGYGYDENRLVVVWARRIALYKRPEALFSDLDRLTKIVKDAKRPVQLIYTGKAHAEDEKAKKVLQDIIGHMQGALSGHAVYIPNYSMEVASYLVKGSDVWLNTPILGKEASGTSGMKAAANGVLQLTVEDGWSYEVDWHELGWTLESESIAPTIYLRLEDDIAPLYYDRDLKGLPLKWIERMRKTISMVGEYSTSRMFGEYVERLYT